MENKEAIIYWLKRKRNGLTIDELSAKTKLNRMTVSTYLRELVAEKNVYVRNLGVTKLHFWKKEKRIGQYGVPTEVYLKSKMEREKREVEEREKNRP